MRSSQWLAFFLLFTAFCASAVAQNTGSTPQSEVASKMRDGYAAFQKGDFSQALVLFRAVATATPENVVAHNMVANAALQLKDFPAAVESFKRALQLQNDEFHNLGGLIRAYTLAGMSKERDELREHILTLNREGKLPENFSYVFDVFDVKDKKVEVCEFLKPKGPYRFRYQFNFYDAGGKLVSRIALESDDFDQPSFAKEHPQEAAAGQRRYSLDSYGPNTHGLIHFYDFEPTYEEIREEIATGHPAPTIEYRPNGITVRKSNPGKPVPPANPASAPPPKPN